MTSTFPEHEQPPNTRIFALSALGSLALHGLIILGLAKMPNVVAVKDDPDDIPTVKVSLLPTSEVSPTPPISEPSFQPRTAIPKAQPLPIPQSPPQRSQPSVPPIQAHLTPSAPKIPAPLPPLPSTKPILKDTRALQAIKARTLMKMRVPAPSRHTASSLPMMNPRSDAEKRVLPPIPKIRESHSTSPSLPAPPVFSTPQILTAPASGQAKPSMTRPTILSSTKPVYPRVARESGWEGTVIVRTLIDANGRPSQANIQQGCGHPILDQAAQDAIMTWTFQPAKDGNIPIPKWVDIPIKFDLKS